MSVVGDEGIRQQDIAFTSSTVDVQGGFGLKEQNVAKSSAIKNWTNLYGRGRNLFAEVGRLSPA